MTHDTPEIVDHSPGEPGDHSSDLEGGLDPDGADADADRRECDFPGCEEPAVAVYRVASPTGPMDMAACEVHQNESVDPAERLEG